MHETSVKQSIKLAKMNRKFVSNTCTSKQERYVILWSEKESSMKHGSMMNERQILGGQKNGGCRCAGKGITKVKVTR